MRVSLYFIITLIITFYYRIALWYDCPKGIMFTNVIVHVVTGRRLVVVVRGFIPIRYSGLSKRGYLGFNARDHLLCQINMFSHWHLNL